MKIAGRNALLRRPCPSRRPSPLSLAPRGVPLRRAPRSSGPSPSSLPVETPFFVELADRDARLPWACRSRRPSSATLPGRRASARRNPALAGRGVFCACTCPSRPSPLSMRGCRGIFRRQPGHCIQMPSNLALQPAACLLRARRCRALAVPTAAAECRVGWAKHMVLLFNNTQTSVRINLERSSDD